MSSLDKNVIFRHKSSTFTTPLEIDRNNRAFVVLYTHGQKGRKEITKKDRIEINLKSLVQINPGLGADYLYQGEFPFPVQENK